MESYARTVHKRKESTAAALSLKKSKFKGKELNVGPCVCTVIRIQLS
jgi:hypothetical protein